MSYSGQESSTYSGLPFELYWITDGVTSWYLTDGDVSRSYNGQTYTPESIARSEIDQNQELQAGSIKVTIPRTHDIASRFISYIPAAQMAVTIYRGHDGDSEVIVYWSGKVSSGTFADEFEMTCVPLQDVLKKRVPAQQYQSQCNWVLYGPGCGVNRGSYLLSATISAVSTDGATLTSSSFATKPDGWWNNGYIEFGQEKRMVLSHSGNQVVLLTGIADLTVGSSIVIYPGCGRNASDCRLKFNNYARFWGFDRIPNKNPFGGNGIA